ncbi:NAD(P)/FAD-dependent oxidoreductase [bacterium]|nr:NAD(P)/FAD-dependent oxidoreductase [bacterium]
MIKKQEKIIIIGAGPAGLAAAYYLLKNSDIKPIIIEESSNIGGISRTVDHNGNKMDIGGHRFFTKSKEVSDFWNEIFKFDSQINTNETGRENYKIFLKRHRISSIFFNNKFFDYPVKINIKTIKNMGFTNIVSSGFGYCISNIIKRKENSLEDFYINRFGKPLYSMFFENYTKKVWGKHPSEIAPDWGNQRVKKLSLLGVVKNYILTGLNLKHEKETSLIEEFLYPPQGPGQFFEEIANEIINLGGEIHKNRKVVQIDFSDNKIDTVKAIDKENNEYIYQCNTVFSSMPIKDLIKSFNTQLDSQIYNISQDLPYRDFMIIGLLVNELNIKQNNKILKMIPDCWIYIQDKNVNIGRLQIYNNWSPYMVRNKDKVYLGLEYFCNENDNLWTKSDKELINLATDELNKIGIINKKDVIDSVVVKVKKAYPAYWGSYKDFDKIREFLNSISNLYCIGRNGQHRYNNMDHSILTGFEAAKAFLNNTDKNKIWEVNTEDRYHETK